MVGLRSTPEPEKSSTEKLTTFEKNPAVGDPVTGGCPERWKLSENG